MNKNQTKLTSFKGEGFTFRINDPELAKALSEAIGEVKIPITHIPITHYDPYRENEPGSNTNKPYCQATFSVEHYSLLC